MLTINERKVLQRNKVERELQIAQAINDIKNLVYKNLNEAFEATGIPRSTLGHRMTGKRKSHVEAHQHEQALLVASEKAIMRWCKLMDDRGFALHIDLLCTITNGIAQRGAEVGVGPGFVSKTWTTRFLNHHPELQTKFAGHLDRQRAWASHPAIIQDHFAKLGRIMRKHALRPFQCFNMDEKGFLLGLSTKAKVVCHTNRHNPQVTQDGTRELITVIESICASGYVLPP